MPNGLSGKQPTLATKSTVALFSFAKPLGEETDWGPDPVDQGGGVYEKDCSFHYLVDPKRPVRAMASPERKRGRHGQTAELFEEKPREAALCQAQALGCRRVAADDEETA